jgi:nucleotide-binding universal stress UspA family protein
MATVDELSGADACDVTVVHTYWPPAAYARLGLRGPRDLVETDPEVVAVLERDIVARFGLSRQSASRRVRVHSAWGRPGDALTDDARADRADLLVVGTRQHQGWSRLESGSSSIAVLRTAHTAVLCVPARARTTAATSDASIPVLRTVLCPTDLSDLGNAAVPYAYALVRDRGGTVELCHVCERPAAGPAHLPYALAAPLAVEEKAELEARLRALVPTDAERLGITTHLTVVEGASASPAIVQASRRLAADAIVLASHGRAGITRALVASVAEQVLRHADRPVFVVRPAGDGVHPGR